VILILKRRLGSGMCSNPCSNYSAYTRVHWNCPQTDDLYRRPLTTVVQRVYRGGQSVTLTPTADTNRIGCHDPLSDVCTLFLQVSDYIGQLCGIF